VRQTNSGAEIGETHWIFRSRDGRRRSAQKRCMFCKATQLVGAILEP